MGLSDMDFLRHTESYISLIDDELKKYIVKSGAETELLHEAVEYALFPGGKRLRPLLVTCVCVGMGGNLDDALPFACAVEMIHAYSLIHDDLPALDNDDIRRGKPSTHKKFGEAMAILAGDALLNRAYEIMAEECVCKLNKPTVRAMEIIAKAAGIYGMVAGQTADILYEGRKADETQLLFIQLNKTAKLISACTAAGAVLGGAEDAEPSIKAGEFLGLAFQIKDDILNVTSDEKTLGKPVLSDEKSEKNTYVSVFGMERAVSDYNKYSNMAIKAFSDLFGHGSFVVKLAEDISMRKK